MKNLYLTLATFVALVLPLFSFSQTCPTKGDDDIEAISFCPGQYAEFRVKEPLDGVQYKWFDSPVAPTVVGDDGYYNEVFLSKDTMAKDDEAISYYYEKEIGTLAGYEIPANLGSKVSEYVDFSQLESYKFTVNEGSSVIINSLKYITKINNSLNNLNGSYSLTISLTGESMLPNAQHPIFTYTFKASSLKALNANSYILTIPFEEVELTPGNYEITINAGDLNSSDFRPVKINLADVVLPATATNGSDFISVSTDDTKFVFNTTQELFPPFFDMDITVVCPRVEVTSIEETDVEDMCCVPLDENEYITIAGPKNVTTPFSAKLNAGGNTGYYYKWFYEGQPISGAEGQSKMSVVVDKLGSYSVVASREAEYIDRASCTKESTFRVVPKALFVSSDIGICEGEETELFVYGAQQDIIWSSTAGDIANRSSLSQTVSPTTQTKYTVEALVHEVNLLKNGNLADGLSEFNTDYQKYLPTPLNTQMNDGFYTVGSQINNNNVEQWEVCKPRAGNNHIFYTRASSQSNFLVAEQIVDVLPQQEYNFSMWASNIQYANSADRGPDGIPAPAPEFIVMINDVPMGGTYVVDGYVCEWIQHKFDWESGSNTSAKISIIQPAIVGPQSPPKPFALADLSFGILNKQTEEIVVDVEPCNEGDFKVSDDVEICYGDSVLLQAFTKGIIKSWEPQEAFNNQIDKNQWVTPNGRGRYEYTVSVMYEGKDNLISNGDFSSGKTLKTSSDLPYSKEAGTQFTEYAYGETNVQPTALSVGRLPKFYNTYFENIPDHTGDAAGNMLIVDGYAEGIVFAAVEEVEAGKEYAFSAWIANINRILQNPASLKFYIEHNGINYELGNLEAASDYDWHNYYEIWKAPSGGLATIIIRNDVEQSQGNDFALDDIAFIPLAPEVYEKTITVTVGDCLPPFVNKLATVCEDVQGSKSASGIDISVYTDSVRDLKDEHMVEWYSDAGLNNLIANQTDVTVKQSANIFYAKIYSANGMDHVTATLTFDIKSIVDVPMSFDPVCAGGESLALAEPSGAEGGVFSGDNVKNGIFIPGEVAGDYEIAYDYIDQNGCENTLTTTIRVAGIEGLAFAKPENICESVESVNIKDLVTVPIDGEGSGSFNESYISTSGVFTHNGAGKYELSYTYTLLECSQTVKDTIIVYDLPEADITPDIDGICIDTDLQLDGNPTNGGLEYTHSWQITGGAISDASVVDPIFSSSVAGSFDIIYTVVDENGCEGSDQITLLVNGVPEVAITAVDPICEYEDNFQLSAELLPAGGTTVYSGDNVTEGGLFLLQDAPVGNNVVTLDYTDPLGCKNSAELTIVVNPKPDVALEGLLGICIDGEAAEITPNIAGGTFVHDAIDDDGVFSPLAAGEGNHEIEYRYTDPATGCKDTAFHTIAVNPLPQPVVSGDSTICSTANAVELVLEPFHSSRSIVEGEGFSKTASGALFDPAGLSAGNYLMTYTYADEFGCEQSTTFNMRVKFTITPEPIDGQGLQTKDGIEVDDIGAVQTIDDNDAEVVWYDKNDNEITNIRGQLKYTTGIEELGLHTFYIRQYYEGCYSEPVPVTLTIVDCPAPRPEGVNVAICETDEIEPISIEPNDNYQIKGWFASTKTDDDNKIGEGPEFLPVNPQLGDNKYYAAHYDEANDCWGPTTEVVFTINPNPVVDVSTDGAYCDYDAPFTPQLTPGGGDLSLDGNLVDFPLSPLDIYNSDQITHTLHYKYTIKETGCFAEKTIEFDVNHTNPPTADDITWMNRYLSTLPNLEAEGQNVRWYDSPSKELLLGEGLIYDTQIIDTTPTGANPYTYYITQTINGCESDPSEVKVHIVDCPTPPPILTDQNICVYDAIPGLNAIESAKWPEGYSPTGNGVMYWFANGNERNISNAIHSGRVYTPSFDLNEGSYTFYVGEWDHECLSPVVPVTITVIETDAPSLSAEDHCQFDQSAVISSSSINTYWFDNADYPVQEGSELMTGQMYPYSTQDYGDQTYYASILKNGCYSVKVPQVVRVLRKPNAPEVADTAHICQTGGNISHTLEAQLKGGNALHWANSFGMPMSSNTVAVHTLIPGVHGFYVKRDSSHLHCMSDSAQMFINYIKKLDAPKIIQPDIYCLGDEIQPVTVSASWEMRNPATKIEWWSEKGASLVSQGRTYLPENVSAAQVIKFEIVAFNGDCPSDTTKESLTVYLTPSVSITGPDSVCVGDREVLYEITDLSHDINDYKYEWNILSEASTVKLVDPNASVGLNHARAEWVSAGVDTLICNTTYKNLCTAHDTILVFISPIPKPNYELEVFSGAGTVKLTNNTELTPIIDGDYYIEQDNEYFWMFKDDFDTVATNYQTHDDLATNNVFLQNGFAYGPHEVSLLAINEFGCRGINELPFFIDIETTLFVPNIFAPGVNMNIDVREFKPKGINLETYEVYIYDTWGNIVWYSDKLNDLGQPAEGWNGCSEEGIPLKADTYIWKINASFSNGKVWKGIENRKNGKIRTMGNVTLVR